MQGGSDAGGIAATPLAGDEAGHWLDRKINAALAIATPPSVPLAYSGEVRELFHRTFLLATQLRHRNVEADHLVVAILTGDEVDLPDDLKGEAGRRDERHQKRARLDEALLARGHAAPLAGAMVRLACLGPATGDPGPEALHITGHLARWIAEAGRAAAERPEGERMVRPDDLLAALVRAAPEGDRGIRSTIRSLLRNASAVGRTQSELVRARQGILNTSRTLGQFRTNVIDRLSLAQNGLKRLEAAGTDTTQALAGLASGLQQVQQAVDRLDRRTEEIAARPLPAPSEPMSVAELPVLLATVGEARQATDAVGTKVESLATGQIVAARRLDELAARTGELAADTRAQREKIDDLAHRLSAPVAPPTAPPEPVAPMHPLRLALLVASALVVGATAGLALTPEGSAWLGSTGLVQAFTSQSGQARVP